MTEKTHNQKTRARITEALKGESLYVNGTKVPLLGENTRRIILDCNDCAIAEIQPGYNIIK
jgi:hypothetical protein